MKTLEFGNEVTQNCVKNKACGMKVKFEALYSLSEMALLMPEAKISDHCSAATFHSVSFSKPNPVWFGNVTPKNFVRFSKPIPVWFGKIKN